MAGELIRISYLVRIYFHFGSIVNQINMGFPYFLVKVFLLYQPARPKSSFSCFLYVGDTND